MALHVDLHRAIYKRLARGSEIQEGLEGPCFTPLLLLLGLRASISLTTNEEEE